MRQIALTAIGEDRPGIVASVCRVLFEAGGNLKDTSMTILSGQFAMILVASVPRALDPTALQRSFDPVREALGIEIFVKDLPDAALLEQSQAPQEGLFLVQVMGADRPGIVYGVAEAMARRRINITDVETRLAGDEKNPIYLVLMEVAFPQGTDRSVVERDLAELGRDLAVEISLRPIEPSTL